MTDLSIAIVMTVFNRREQTERCINSILNANKYVCSHLSFFITNDGSTDDTNELLINLAQESTSVDFKVLQGDGSLFWNRGMHKAYSEALKGYFDYYLWINNDVEFHENFLTVLLKDAETISRQSNLLYMICGPVSYFNTNTISYGGSENLSRINPYKRKMVVPDGKIHPCHCINGNCVLIPYNTAKCIGNVDWRYEHGFGDFDYGYTLIKAGGQPYSASAFVGYCNRNTHNNTWNDSTLPISVRIHKKNSPTGLPYFSHKLFLKKWFPYMRLWFLWKPYIRIVFTSIFYKLRGK